MVAGDRMLAGYSSAHGNCLKGEKHVDRPTFVDKHLIVTTSVTKFTRSAMDRLVMKC